MLLEKRIPVWYILNKVKFDLISVLVVSLIILVVTDVFKGKFPEMPLTIPAFLGTAISILLSFKLNQSYDRWWEARKVWGSIVNDSRTLVLQLNSMAGGEREPLVKKIAQRQIAWCYSLSQSLRNLDPIQNLESYLTPEDIAEISRHQNKPLALLQLHAKDIVSLKNQNTIDGFSHLQLDNTLVRLCDAQGRAERIKSTVFPSTYRRFLHFTIYLFVITLSLALNVTGLFEIPLLILISTSFFLLEKSATHMQDPFENKPTDTAMTTITQKIELNIKQLVGLPVAQPAPATETFYLM